MGSPLNLPPIPQQWRPLFMALLQILQTKQSQLEFLSKERKLLEDRINLQHHLWSQDLASFRDAIVENERDRKKLKWSLLLEAARSVLVIGMKEKDALLYKLKLEYIESDLEDMKMFIKLQSKFSNKKNVQSENKYVELAVKEDSQHELRRLNREYEKLACQKETEVSALLSERDFVWNQLKRMEDEYMTLLKGKGKDLESARVLIGNLENEMKKLQSATNEKETIIGNLNSQIIERNDEVGRLSLKLSKLSENLETIMTAKSASAAPLDDHSFDTGEGGFLQVEDIANKPGKVQVADKDEDVRSMDNLLIKMKEMSKEMEIKSIENENLRLLCSELEHELNKQKNHLKNAFAPKEVISRNLIDELTTASSKDGDGKLPAKTCYQQRKVQNKVGPLNGPSLVGSHTPEFKGEGTKVPKGGRSLSKKRGKSESKIGRQSLFSSAFKVPRLKASRSVVV